MITDIIIVFASTVAGLFIGYAFHYAMHKIEFMNAKHKAGHHDLYKRTFKFKTYIHIEANLIDFKLFKLEVEYLVLIPVFFYLLTLYFIISFYLWLVCLCIAAASLYITGYLHQAYHIKNHWLLRYRWFRLATAHHARHHVDPDVWYGLGVSDVFDVLFRTTR